VGPHGHARQDLTFVLCLNVRINGSVGCGLKTDPNATNQVASAGFMLSDRWTLHGLSGKQILMGAELYGFAGRRSSLGGGRHLRFEEFGQQFVERLSSLHGRDSDRYLHADKHVVLHIDDDADKDNEDDADIESPAPAAALAVTGAPAALAETPAEFEALAGPVPESAPAAAPPRRGRRASIMNRLSTIRAVKRPLSHLNSAAKKISVEITWKTHTRK